MFSLKFCEFFKNTFLTQLLRETASVFSDIANWRTFRKKERDAFVQKCTSSNPNNYTKDSKERTSLKNIFSKTMPNEEFFMIDLF